MATIVAVRSGNWSDTSHVTGPWPGASTPTTKPGVGDTVQAGEFVVEIDEDVHVAMLEATGSGYFAVSNVYPAPQRPNITAAIVNNETANGTLQINGGTIGNIIGNLTAGNANGACAVYNGGTIGDITGNLTAGNANGACAVYNNSGTIGDITGNLTAGDVDGAYAVYNGGGTIGDITGDLTAGDAGGACAVYNDVGTIGDITGNLTAGNAGGACAVYNNDGGTIGDITGDLTAGNANGAWAVYNNGGGTIGDITGDMTAGNAGGAFAVYNNDGGTIGDIDGSLICGATGQFPIFGPFRLVANPANNVTFCQPNGNPWTLSNDYPAPADVRSGVEYDRGTQTGEMAAGGSIGPVSIVIGGGGIRIS